MKKLILNFEQAMPYHELKNFKLSDKVQITSDIIRNKDFVLSVPPLSGVYLITADKEFERIRGNSDILYIGRSGNLRTRMKYLLKYFLPLDFVGNWGRHTARDALKTIIEETKIKIFLSYVTCQNCKDIETLLLQKYCKNHIESPPLNNQRK